MKELMDGYEGVKFSARCLGAGLPREVPSAYEEFRQVGDLLRQKGLTYRNAGNMSLRCQRGFLITAARTNLGSIEENELVYVEACSLGRNSVAYCGPKEPSSEALMHYLILKHRPEAGSVIHAHDPLATSDPDVIALVDETPREEPYGTVALARLALLTFRKDRRIIILKNHGYVAIGADIKGCAEVILETHGKLLSKWKELKGEEAPSMP